MCGPCDVKETTINAQSTERKTGQLAKSSDRRAAMQWVCLLTNHRRLIQFNQDRALEEVWRVCDSLTRVLTLPTDGHKRQQINRASLYQPGWVIHKAASSET